MRMLLAGAAIVALQVTAAVPAMAQSGFMWSYYRYLDPDPFAAYLGLVFGIPETDATQFVAVCQIGAGGTYATIDLGADIGNYQPGQTVEVQVTSSSGFNQVYYADILRPMDEGIWGVQLAVQMDDQIWSAIQYHSQLYYNLVGFTANQLPLAGSSTPTGQFVSDCANGNFSPAGVGNAGAPPPPPGQIGNAGGAPAPGFPASCSYFGSLVSTNGGADASITFINDSGSYRTVMWLDHSGTPIQYAGLNPGESYLQQTVVGHPWMMTDGPGNCTEIYMPAAGNNVFYITAPAGNFGPE